MAFPQMFAILAIAIILPSVVLSTKYIVGDDQGWTINFNYSKWTPGKTFRVGDSLVFNYDKDNHNVFKVNGALFKARQVPLANTNNSLTTGNDVVPLKTAGNKWYICGAEGHCDLGQKLVITVLDNQSPAPAPSASNRTSVSGLASLIGAAIMLIFLF
ncbi:hypothetical protein QJS04_geneDACA009421 [Acorus gramineus]|uniref:Phytocyanin domain-containing protein n=1 Tax=Acorus gramineus TaxID=55184 RepID=A0AAV9AIU4_ACOGR|nr:hypothetical protein QJS04_geneDACA009421 [Acorus gramineus]